MDPTHKVPFKQLMLAAKRATGYNFPTTESFDSFGVSNPEVERAICIEAKRVQGLPDDAEIASDDKEHYSLENVIAQALVALYEECITQHDLRR